MCFFFILRICSIVSEITGTALNRPSPLPPPVALVMENTPVGRGLGMPYGPTNLSLKYN